MATDTTHPEADRVAALYRLGVLDTPAEDRFDRVVRLARQLFGVSTALVSLVDRDVVVHKAMAGFDEPVVPRDDSFCGTAVLSDAMLVVPDAAQDERFRDKPFVAAPGGLRFYAGQPLVAPGGYRVGTLCIADPEPRAFGADSAALLRDLAAWVEKELVIDSELMEEPQGRQAIRQRCQSEKTEGDPPPARGRRCLMPSPGNSESCEDQQQRECEECGNSILPHGLLGIADLKSGRGRVKRKSQ